jgi:2-polyprenyl-3-methyl-5-hydroxy-6-metoxy-1,4-benzoquinol methylase
MGEVRLENGKRNHRQPQTAADTAPAKKRRRSPWFSAPQIATHGPDRYSEARNRSSSDESRIDMVQDLAAQYEAYPYPYRDPERETPGAPVVTMMNDLTQISHYVSGGENHFNGKCRVLIAGGGTGDATVHLASQLAGNPSAEIVHMDLSDTSIALARRRVEKHGVRNVIFVKESLLNLLEGKYGTFDYINCSGVLHHLEHPIAGAKALRSVLNKNGAISIMLYGFYGRRITYDIQSMARIVRYDEDDLGSLIDLTRGIITAVPPNNPLKHKVHGDDAPPNEIVDAYLNVRDRAYTVPQIYELIEHADLKIATFIPSILYNPGLFVKDATLRKRLTALSKEERQTFAELLLGSIDRHIFYVVRRDDEALESNPRDMTLIPVMDRSTKKSFDDLPPGTLGAQLALPIPQHLSQQHLQIIRQIDGKQSIASILQKVMLPKTNAFEDKTSLWLFVYEVFNSRNLLHLKKP